MTSDSQRRLGCEEEAFDAGCPCELECIEECDGVVERTIGMLDEFMKRVDEALSHGGPHWGPKPMGDALRAALTRCGLSPSRISLKALRALPEK